MATYQAARAKFVPPALQLPSDSIRELRVDMRLVLVTIRLGVQAVLEIAVQVNEVNVLLPLVPWVDVLDLRFGKSTGLPIQH